MTRRIAKLYDRLDLSNLVVHVTFVLRLPYDLEVRSLDVRRACPGLASLDVTISTSRSGFTFARENVMRCGNVMF